jgi:hypothetical protein
MVRKMHQKCQFTRHLFIMLSDSENKNKFILYTIYTRFPIWLKLTKFISFRIFLSIHEILDLHKNVILQIFQKEFSSYILNMLLFVKDCVLWTSLKPGGICSPKSLVNPKQTLVFPGKCQASDEYDFPINTTGYGEGALDSCLLLPPLCKLP